jgi:hypothetical protein
MFSRNKSDKNMHTPLQYPITTNMQTTKIPSKALAPKITRPTSTDGKSTSHELEHWLTAERGDKEGVAAINKQVMNLIDLVVNMVYK